MPGSPGNTKPTGAVGKHSGLLAWTECAHPIAQFLEWVAVVIPEAQVDGEIAGDLKVVLRVYAEELVAVALPVGIRLIVETGDVAVCEIVDNRIACQAGNNRFTKPCWVAVPSKARYPLLMKSKIWFCS